MGWFWADAPNVAIPSQNPHGRSTLSRDAEAKGGCPMNRRTVDKLNPNSNCRKPADSLPSSCPVPHTKEKPSSILSQLNPLNYMFRDLSQSPAPHQTHRLPTSRDESSIPKAKGNENWEYPSPQQMYNALLRKGYTDTDVTAVEDMVAVHNFLNEGAWAEVVSWEQRFSQGLQKGWEICKRGEENAPEMMQKVRDGDEPIPTLIRFQGRPKDMTPKAALLQLAGWAFPDRFGGEPPFDRHDWYVSRTVNGETKEIRYVIDYYSGPPEPTGEPVFFLDVRPAMTPTGAAERLIRWGSDTWWKASGAAVREERHTKK